MKKIIITESQYRRLILKEESFANQDIVDRLLDKINEKGYDSLEDWEKHILKNPNEEIVKGNEQDSNCIDDTIKLLFLNDLVDSEKMNVYDEFIEVYHFKDAPNLEWFNGENFLRMYCIWDGGRKVYMDFEDNGEDRTEVINHLKNVWEETLPDTEFLTDDGMSEID